MKNVIYSKFNLIVLFLLFSLVVQADEIPIRGNWLNPMEGGAPKDFLDGPTYIFLDEDGALQINLIITTTDYNVSLYDELHIEYNLGGIEGTIGPISKDDFIAVGTGLYEATYPRTLDFSTQCLGDTDGMIRMVVEMGLRTPKSATELDAYPFANNTGFFAPEVYENLDPTVTVLGKMLLCWGTNPPTSMIINNDALTAAADKGEENGQASLNLSLEQGIEEENAIRSIAVQPNPFTNRLQLLYQLDTPSDVEVMMMDLNGKRLIHQKYAKQVAGLHNLSFDLESDLPAGLYMIHLVSDEETVSTKVIKLKTN